MSAFRYHLRSLTVRGRTTLAAGAGISMVSYMVAATLMLVDGLEKSVGAIDRRDTAIVISSSADSEFSSSIFDADAAVVATEPGVKREKGRPLALSELVVTATLPKKDGHRGSVQLRGVPDDVLQVRSNAKIIAGRAARFAADEVLIGERLRGRFRGFEVGDSFELRKGRMMKVVGVMHAGPAYDSEVWLDIAAARATFGRQGRLSSIYVRLERPESFAAFKSALKQDKRLGLVAFREHDYFQVQTEGRASFIMAMGSLIGLLFAIGAMIGAMITMFAAVESRQREVGTLRALGFSRSAILFGFLLESSAVAILAGVAGALAAAGLAFAKFTMLDLNTRAEVILNFVPTPQVIAVAIAGSLLMGLGGGILPAWRAAQVSIIEAIRG